MSVSEYAALMTELGEDQAFAVVRYEHGFEYAERLHGAWFRYLLECDR